MFKTLAIGVLLSASLVGCGVELNQKLDEVKKYLHDHNITRENLSNGYSELKDDLGERAEKVREYLSDRGFSVEDVDRANENMLAEVGHRFKAAQKYLYDRGICVIYNGDHCGSDQQVADSSSSSNAPATNGTDGTDGRIGTAGPIGKVGPAGNTGSTGKTGTTGTAGTTGTTGSTGKTGSTGSSAALGPKAVDLGLAGNFTLLSKSGITNIPNSIVVGDIGTSPITGASITALDCVQVIGQVYTVDAAGPACRSQNATYLTTAVADMQTAYTDAAGRSNPDFTELGAGEIGGLTLTPGLYKWSSSVLISSDVVLKGGDADVFIFQISGNLTEASSVHVVLDGVLAKNVFWQVAGSTTLETSTHFEGTILCATLIAMKTGATANSRFLAQTAITLQTNTINKP